MTRRCCRCSGRFPWWRSERCSGCGCGATATEPSRGCCRRTGRRSAVTLEAGEGVGLEREGGEGQLSDELLGALAEQLRPGHRGNDHGASWRRLEVERGFITERQQEGLRLTKIHSLLAGRGVLVPYRTLHRFCVAELGFGRQRRTVRVADGEPGH